MRKQKDPGPPRRKGPTWKQRCSDRRRRGVCVRTVMLFPAERRKGRTGATRLAAFGFASIADWVGCGIRDVREAAASGELDITSFDSILRFCYSRNPIPETPPNEPAAPAPAEPPG